MKKPKTNRSCAWIIFLVLTHWIGLAAEGPRPFPIRGMLPWHNFLSGPTGWNETDWERYLDWMQQQRLNLLVLHCYTGGAQRYVNYVEPLVRIQYRNVLPEAFLDTSLTARWGYRPLAVKDFAFGTGKLFSGPACGCRAALRARTNEERYRLAQGLLRRVFEMAHARGIQVGMGFEFGVYPPELFSIVPQDSYLHESLLPDPTHPASQEILRITINDIVRAYPQLDWLWLWLGEHGAPSGTGRLSGSLQKLVDQNGGLFGAGDRNMAFTGAWSLEYIRSAYACVQQRAPKVRVAISGWGGAGQLNGLLNGLDKVLPTGIVFTCLNPAQGLSAQPVVLGEIAAHRPVLIIPWLEGDSKLWHPQPRVTLLRDQVELAHKQGAQGVVAIHWRTEDIRANMNAFAEFARDPEAANADSFYQADARAQFGPAAEEVAPLLARMDREQWFEPMRSMEFFPYDPSWGRLNSDQRTRFRSAAERIAALAKKAQDKRCRANLRWLAANLEFTLLLDEVSAAMEPAYHLKDSASAGADVHKELAAARKALAAAPIQALFTTYAGRVRSRGELGVLSSLNQKVWLQYRELKAFLDEESRP